MAQQQQQQLVLMQCAQQQLAIERSLHQLACQEAVLIKEKHEHEQQYDSKDAQEVRAAQPVCASSYGFYSCA